MRSLYKEDFDIVHAIGLYVNDQDKKFQEYCVKRKIPAPVILQLVKHEKRRYQNTWSINWINQDVIPEESL